LEKEELKSTSPIPHSISSHSSTLSPPSLSKSFQSHVRHSQTFPPAIDSSKSRQSTLSNTEILYRSPSTTTRSRSASYAEVVSRSLGSSSTSRSARTSPKTVSVRNISHRQRRASYSSSLQVNRRDISPLQSYRIKYSPPLPPTSSSLSDTTRSSRSKSFSSSQSSKRRNSTSDRQSSLERSSSGRAGFQRSASDRLLKNNKN